MSINRTVILLFLVLILLNIQTVEAKAKKNDKKVKSAPIKSEKCDPKKNSCNKI